MRIRTTQACSYCRKKKIRCDGEKPECRHCRDSKIQCEYTSSKKRGPRKGYVQVLEERLNQMEKRLMHPEIIVNDTSVDNISVPHDLIDQPIQLYKIPRISSAFPSIEIIDHLTEIFFKNINSVFFFVHRASFMKSIQNGTVSERLLYSIMALSSRFSDHPTIHTSPPYLSSQYYAQKAYSLIDGESMEPNLENIKFWAIMSLLEYGRASGPKSWIYGSMAMRFCQELQYYKEEVLSAPILNEEGKIDSISMSVRRHLFWTCYYIDKLSSAGTHRPQCIERTDIDARPPILSEIRILQDYPTVQNIYDERVPDNSLANITPYFVHIVGLFGDVNKCMNRASTRPTSINWPPIVDFKSLDSRLHSWVENLPDIYQFNNKNLEYHKRNAGATYFNEWLSAHAFWCSSMMLLHRGSLAFGSLTPSYISEDVYKNIQKSVDACRTSVDSGMEIFNAICDSCGFSTLPYLGYSSYIFVTVLMTSTFSGTLQLYNKSSEGLKMLCRLVDKLAPYWPVCEKLAKTIYDLITLHQNLYQFHNTSRRCSSESTCANDVDLSYSCQTSVNSITPPIRSPTGLSISIPSSTTLSPPSFSLSSIKLSPTGSSSSYSPVPFSSTQIDTIAPLSVSPTSLSSNNEIFNRENSSYHTMPLSSADVTLSETLGSIHSSSDPLSDTFDSGVNMHSQVDINNFEIRYDTSLFGEAVFDSSSLFASSDDPIPDMSYTPSVTRGSLDSGYDPLFIEGCISEEQLATSFGSSDSQWNCITL